MSNLLISDRSRVIWHIAKKLVSIGYLLESQGEDEGGISELVGLGMIVTGLGEELGNLSVELREVGQASSG